MPSKGFSMIETMVALSILVIIGTAIITLVLTMIAANTTAKLRNQGLGFAEEGMEQLRNYFQTNGYQALNSLSNSKCYSDGTLQNPVSPCPGTSCSTGQIAGSSFYRYVELTQPNGAVKAQSVVSWNDRGVCRSTEIDTNFYSY